MTKNLKPLYLILILFAVHTKVFSQDFFKDYTKFLESINERTNLSINQKHLWALQSVKTLRHVFNKVRTKEHISMLNTDTLYIINYNGPSRQISSLIWNRKNTCYYKYDYSYNTLFSKIKNGDPIITTNSIKLLNELDPDLKAIVEKNDTSGYNKYMKLHTTSTFMSFNCAIKKEGHWTFTQSKVYGYIIDGNLFYLNKARKEI